MNKRFYKVSGKVGDTFLTDNINSITFKIYLIMLKRASITKFIDENNESYFILTRDEIVEATKHTRKIDISNGIEILKKMGIIKYKKTKGKATKYYLLE